MNQRSLHIGGSLIYIMLLALMASIGRNWEEWSPGFASPLEDGPFFCRELQSAGGDDDAMVGAFMVFALPLILRVLRLPKPAAGFEVWLFYLCAGFVCFSLTLASLDCAHVFYTAFSVPDLALATALLAMPVSALMLACLRAGSRQH